MNGIKWSLRSGFRRNTMILGVTGHRPERVGGYLIPNPIYDYVISEMKSYILAIKPEKIITGMALGVDTWAASVAIELGIPFIAAVPFLGQADRWQASERHKYVALLSKAVEVVMVSEDGYAEEKLQTRNEWIVDHSDEMLVVYDGKPGGGTKRCAKYAAKKGVLIKFIVPKVEEESEYPQPLKIAL